MKSLSIIILSCFVTVSSGFCQKVQAPAQKGSAVNVYWGKEYPINRSENIILMGKKGDYIFGYREKPKMGLFKGSIQVTSIVKFSAKDMSFKGDVPIVVEGDKSGNDYVFNSFLMLKNKWYITFSRYDRKADLNSVFVQEIGPDGKITGKSTKIGDISSNSKANSGKFEFYMSEDSTKFLLVNNPPYKKYAGEKFNFKVYDQFIKQISNSDVALPYKDKNFSSEDYIVSNEGNVFMLAKIYLDRKDRDKDEAKFYYEILGVDPAGKGDVTEYEVKLPGNFVQEVSFKLLDGKDIVCAGFSGDLDKNGFWRDEINGIFYLRINSKTKEVVAKGLKQLDKDFVADLTSKRKAEKGKGISANYVLKNFIKKSDGGAILVAEQSWVEARTTTTSTGNGGMTTTTTYYYHRNNIIVININSEGSIKWYTNIPKEQITTNDYGIFSSYMLGGELNSNNSFNDKMYIVYNDNPANLDPKKVKTPKDIRAMTSPMSSTAVVVEINEAGKFSKKSLFSAKETNMPLMPSLSKRISLNEKVVTALYPGFFCCVIPIKKPIAKLVKFEFK